MPRIEKPASQLSARTLNNMRSEMYQMNRRLALEPDHPDRDFWQQRAEKIRLRLGEEAIPFQERTEGASAQASAQAALDELQKLTQGGAEDGEG